MAKLDLQSIGKVYDDIVLDARSVNWFILTYKKDSIDTIGLYAKGDGDLDYIKSLLNESMVAFIYLKIIEDNPSTGQKMNSFIHITFIGKNVKSRERSRAVLHRHDVHRQFSDYILEYDANELSDLDEKKIKAELKKVREFLAN